MRILCQPLEEAYETLVRDNPGREIAMSESGIWLHGKSGDWYAIISGGFDDKFRVWENGERTLTMGDEQFRQYMLEGCTRRSWEECCPSIGLSQRVNHNSKTCQHCREVTRLCSQS